MLYKIPVQIENEDPIFLGLSLRQIFIILIGGGISYQLFKSLVTKIEPSIAAILPVIIFIFTLIIALFKHSEMTFIPFILSFIRLKINSQQRTWVKTVDSFQPIDIGYIQIIGDKKQETIDFSSKIDKISKLEDKINKI